MCFGSHGRFDASRFITKKAFGWRISVACLFVHFKEKEKSQSHGERQAFNKNGQDKAETDH